METKEFVLYLDRVQARTELVVGNTPGMDLALSRDRIKGYKNFANKNPTNYLPVGLSFVRYKTWENLSQPLF